MINLSELNSFPSYDGSLALLKELTRKYCPEEVREMLRNIVLKRFGRFVRASCPTSP